MFIYPWGDMHSLNLGWFLMEFKAWVEKIQEYLDNGGGTSENLANVIAPVFNAENSYLTGDYVLYNDELYKALEPVPAGTWNPDAWVRCLVTEEMGSASSGVDNVARLMIAGQYSNTYNYQKYAICRYADKLWMCNTNLPTGGEEWEPSHWDEITVGAGLTGLRRSADTLSVNIDDLNSEIAALKTKSISNVATPGVNITTLELTAVKVGNVVNLYLVFIPTNNLTYTGDVICSNMEYLPFNAMQIPAYCVSGSHLGQTTRLMMSMAGQIQTHYSGPTPQAGEAWFVNTSYICD